MHRQIGKLARKQSNYDLAERLLARDDTYSNNNNLENTPEYTQWMEFEGIKLRNSQVNNAEGDIFPVLVDLLSLSQLSNGTFVFHNPIVRDFPPLYYNF